MKKLIYLLLAFISIQSYAQTYMTDAEMTVKSNQIKNETVAGANTKERFAYLFQRLIDSKINVSRLSYVVATGTNAYTVTITPLPLSPGLPIFVYFDNANSGASTLTVTGVLSTIPIVEEDGSAVESGDIGDNQVKLLVYNGTSFQIVGGTGSGGGGGTWGSITGTLSDQTDLQTALNTKQSTITFGTGVQTALGVNVGSAGAPIVNGGVLGTPSGGTLTNATGLPVTGLAAGSASAFDQIRRNAGNTAWENYAPLLNPATTNGDLLYYNGTTYDRLAVGTSTQFVKGGTIPSWGSVLDSDLSTSDITTNNVTTAKHGFTPKLPNDATKYLDGTGAYSVPVGSAAGLATTGTSTFTGPVNFAGTSTNTFTMTFPSLGTTATIGAGILLTNTANAALGAQQISPVFTQRGKVWETTGGTPQVVEYSRFVRPIQGTSTTRRAADVLQFAYNGGTPVDAMSVTKTGGGQGINVDFYDQTDATNTNYTKLQISTDRFGVGSGVVILNTKGGTGTLQPLYIENDGDVGMFFRINAGHRWAISTSGESYAFKPMADNAYDLGLVGTRVRSIYSSGSFSAGYVAKTALYTLTATDYTVEVTSGTHTQTLPTAVGIPGRVYVITNTGSGTVTIGTTSSQTFANVSGTPTTLSLAQFQTKQVISNGANWLLTASF